MVTENRS